LKRRYRTYAELEGPDRSGLPEQIAEQRERVESRLAQVNRTVAIMSGKGGVGKSLISAALATALRADGLAVGLLDGDLHSPSAARMCGVEPGALPFGEDGVKPAIGGGGVAVMSMELLLPEGAPLAWHGPGTDGFVWEGAEERRALREFLSDVQWGALDWLVIDLPPGTRAMIDLFELVPALGGLVAVTLPAGAARASAERALNLAKKRSIPVLGVVENMAGYSCPGCGELRPLFPGEGGRDLSVAHGAELLGRVPFDPEAAVLADRGQMVSLLADTACGHAMRSLVDRLVSTVERR
jgi:ATP-binding protein involved in chromosome partitioning